jgi:hypothetical protein
LSGLNTECNIAVKRFRGHQMPHSGMGRTLVNRGFTWQS